MLTVHVKFSFYVIFCLIYAIIIRSAPPAKVGRSVTTADAPNDSVQHEVKKFYSSLNAEEKAQLRKFAKTYAANFSLTDTQFMDGLKEEAAGLFGKLSGLRDAINAKLDTMQPESRNFVEQVLRKFLAAFSQDGIMNILDALKGLGKEILFMYDGLSGTTQQDILKAFPTLASIATSDVVRLILQKMAEFDLVSKTWTPAPTVNLDTDDDSKGTRHRSLGPKPKEPGNEEPTIPSYHEKMTTVYPSITDDDEPLYVKEIRKNK